MFKKRRVNKKTKATISIKALANDSDSDEDVSADVKTVEVVKPILGTKKDDKSNEKSIKTSDEKPQLSNLSKDEATKEDRLASEFAKEDSDKIIQKPTVKTLDTTTYTGQKGYSRFVKKDNNKPGPVKTASNIRSTTVIDFQPDVCKDFQQHGYCGYGDTCKFLHIRDEFKKTKQVDKEWEMVAQKKRKRAKQPRIEKLI